jgi:alpha-L-fucosidase
MITINQFVEFRFGLFVHYGLYSTLERGEWAMNREKIPKSQLREIAEAFDPSRFDADALCRLAVDAGMKYVVLTSMHHDGFCLYKSELSDFTSHALCGRDLCAEIITAARSHGLAVGLYHSLNNWLDDPDAVDALENTAACERFIQKTHNRVEELVRNYDFDILWYDGWWPFDEEGWKGEVLNEKCRSIRPGLLFNPRNGAEGDFVTPEQHLSAPTPWEPWEGCVTLNDNWGYHRGDDNWKSPKDVIKLLCQAAAGNGNLLLNIAPRGDGSVPEACTGILEEVGQWIRRCGQCLQNNSIFTYDLEKRAGHTGDWCHHGPMTVSGTDLFMIATSWPGREWTLSGLDAEVESVKLLPEGLNVKVDRVADGVFRFHGLPEMRPDPLAPVFRIRCDRVPQVYNCGGMRTPTVPHAPYDPMPSDLAH